MAATFQQLQSLFPSSSVLFPLEWQQPCNHYSMIIRMATPFRQLEPCFPSSFVRQVLYSTRAS
eukprot:1156229-Pelagomonas_calceolata.AAC.13